MKRLFPLLLTLTVLAACRPQSSKIPPKAITKLNVVATTPMLADLATNICGDLCQVSTIVPAGASFHTYTPTEDDIKRIQEADLVFSHGKGFEPGLADALTKAETKVTYLDRAFLPEGQLKLDGKPNLHYWLDPKIWHQVQGAMVSVLSEKLPANQKFDSQNAAYGSKLLALDSEIVALLKPIPPNRRILVTPHAAFSYFAANYGFKTFNILGSNPAAKPTEKQINDLVHFLVENKIDRVFVESGIDPASMRSVQKAARAKGLNLRIAGQLQSDTLGHPGSPDSTVIGLIRQNAKTIAEALK